MVTKTLKLPKDLIKCKSIKLIRFTSQVIDERNITQVSIDRHVVSTSSRNDLSEDFRILPNDIEFNYIIYYLGNSILGFTRMDQMISTVGYESFYIRIDFSYDYVTIITPYKSELIQAHVHPDRFIEDSGTNRRQVSTFRSNIATKNNIPEISLRGFKMGDARFVLGPKSFSGKHSNYHVGLNKDHKICFNSWEGKEYLVNYETKVTRSNVMECRSNICVCEEEIIWEDGSVTPFDSTKFHAIIDPAEGEVYFVEKGYYQLSLSQSPKLRDLMSLHPLPTEPFTIRRVNNMNVEIITDTGKYFLINLRGIYQYSKPQFIWSRYVSFDSDRVNINDTEHSFYPMSSPYAVTNITKGKSIQSFDNLEVLAGLIFIRESDSMYLL